MSGLEKLSKKAVLVLEIEMEEGRAGSSGDLPLRTKISILHQLLGILDNYHLVGLKVGFLNANLESASDEGREK